MVQGTDMTSGRASMLRRIGWAGLGLLWLIAVILLVVSARGVEVWGHFP